MEGLNKMAGLAGLTGLTPYSISIGLLSESNPVYPDSPDTYD